MRDLGYWEVEKLNLKTPVEVVVVRASRSVDLKIEESPYGL
jgi:hypothetical protein